MYDPETGQFISRDPLGSDADDLNLYRYVGNNPVDAIDPSGLQPPEAPTARITGVRPIYVLPVGIVIRPNCRAAVCELTEEQRHRGQLLDPRSGVTLRPPVRLPPVGPPRLTRLPPTGTIGPCPPDLSGRHPGRFVEATVAGQFSFTESFKLDFTGAEARKYRKELEMLQSMQQQEPNFLAPWLEDPQAHAGEEDFKRFLRNKLKQAGVEIAKEKLLPELKEWARQEGIRIPGLREDGGAGSAQGGGGGGGRYIGNSAFLLQKLKLEPKGKIEEGRKLSGQLDFRVLITF